MFALVRDWRQSARRPLSRLLAPLCALLVAVGPVQADDDADKYPGSPLYSKPVEVAPGVWSAIGATQPPTYENAGHNNNLSFVIGGEAVLVVNGGANAKLAEALDQEIQAVTDLPVRYVINENGQGHAMLGNSYWHDKGATLIAHEDAWHEYEDRSAQILSSMQTYARENSEGTRFVEVDETFTDHYEVDLGGGVVAIAKVYGPAHSPGDVSVLVPSANVIIAGDMAFHVRIPPIFAETNTKLWLESFALFAEEAKDMIIIPGHGGPTTLASVDAGTRGYLKYLRSKVRALLDEGGTLEDAFQIDQSPYKDYDTFDELAARNAGRVFEEMEFEDW